MSQIYAPRMQVFFVLPDATVESQGLKLLSTQWPECRGNERGIRGRGGKGTVAVSTEGEFLWGRGQEGSQGRVSGQLLVGGVTQNTLNTFPALTGYSGWHVYVVMKCMLLAAYRHCAIYTHYCKKTFQGTKISCHFQSYKSFLYLCINHCIVLHEKKTVRTFFPKASNPITVYTHLDINSSSSGEGVWRLTVRGAFPLSSFSCLRVANRGWTYGTCI